MLVPVFAVLFGYIPYVVMGTLCLLIFAGRIDVTVRNSALMGLVSYLIFAVGFIIWARVFDPSTHQPLGLNLFFFACGLIFAPLWCATAALLYRFFTRQHKGDTT